MVQVDATRFKSCFNFLRVKDGFSNKALFKANIPLFEIQNLSLYLLISHFSINLLTLSPEISMPFFVKIKKLKKIL